jgi:hypothetical protein
MGYKFKDDANEKYRAALEEVLLTSDNPFPRNPVCNKENLPAFCLGRDEEIGIIKNAIEKVATEASHPSAWIPIHGDGGTGKSTLALYLYNKAKNQKSKDLNIEHIEANYVECPTDPEFLNIQNLYKWIMEDFGDKNVAYPYYLAYQFCLRFGKDIMQNTVLKAEFERRFGSIWASIARTTTYLELQVVMRKECPNFAAEFKQLLTDYDFLIRDIIPVGFDYITLIVDLLSTDATVRTSALENVMGKRLKNEEEARDQIKRLIQTLNYVFEKGCLLIIIDNLENLPPTSEAYHRLFQLLLKFRNEIHNCVVLTVSSTDPWRRFTAALNGSEMNMIKGLKYDEITLRNLSEEDAAKIMQRRLDDFWSATKIHPQGGDQLYPFSRDAFKYLYEINDRNLRESLKNLYQILESWKNKHDIAYVKDTLDAIYYFKPENPDVYIYENEMEALERYLNETADRTQLSLDMERGLHTCFIVIRNAPVGKAIHQVEHARAYPTRSGKEARPDIYLTLAADDTLQKIRRIEFQVKAYFQTNPVCFNEIEGSLNLVKDGKTHYLHFLTTSPLEEKILENLKPFTTRVGRLAPLKADEACYLLLLTLPFIKLFFKTDQLDAVRYVQILEKMNIKVPALFDEVLSLPEGGGNAPDVVVPPEKKKEERPKMTAEKISNPALLEPKIIEILRINTLVPKRDDLIKLVLPYAKSESAISNALTSLKNKKQIQYSREKPTGWSLVPNTR